MASSINASTAGAGGLISTADASGVLQLQSNGTQTVNVATNGIITNTFNSAAGIVEGYQYYALNTGYTGTQATTAQSALGVGVTLASSTIYEIEFACYLIKSAGTTSHSFSQLLGGTCTTNYINASTSFGPASFTGVTNVITALNSSLLINSGITSAAYYVQFVFKGIISVNAGGTLIPQYQLSAAPGGAYTTQAGSYMKIAPLGASGSNILIGSWA
jgi:hypothetical protein